MKPLILAVELRDSTVRLVYPNQSKAYSLRKLHSMKPRLDVYLGSCPAH